MMTRRPLILGAAACAAALPGLSACSGSTAVQDAALALRRSTALANNDASSGAGNVASNDASKDASKDTRIMQELVRSATLAPSSHNTQCWQFHIAQASIAITPDLARRCPAVDPDDHHLFVSLGCATENLVQAALAHGLHAEPLFNAEPNGASGGRIVIGLETTKSSASSLYPAIAERHCTLGDYDSQPLTSAELQMLDQAGTGDGVSVRLLTTQPAIESVLAYVMAANTEQMGDPAFVAELTSWIRFSADEALQTGDGLFAAASGNPALPRWLGSRMMGLFYTPKSENEKYARQIRNSAGIAVFVSERNDKAHWVEAGRCCERFALQATALGIRNAFLNPPVEVGAVRSQFAVWLGLQEGERPDLVVRFGRGPAMPWSMRRPVQAVLV